MNSHNLFNAGPSAGLVPQGDRARQAVASLRGYAYQALAGGLTGGLITTSDKSRY